MKKLEITVFLFALLLFSCTKETPINFRQTTTSNQTANKTLELRHIESNSRRDTMINKLAIENSLTKQGSDDLLDLSYVKAMAAIQTMDKFPTIFFAIKQQLGEEQYAFFGEDLQKYPRPTEPELRVMMKNRNVSPDLQEALVAALREANLTIGSLDDASSAAVIEISKQIDERGAPGLSPKAACLASCRSSFRFRILECGGLAGMAAPFTVIGELFVFGGCLYMANEEWNNCNALCK